MKILITGSNGLLGQSIAELCSQNNQINYLCTSQGENRNSRVPASRYRSINLCDQSEWTAVYNDFEPDVVIHTAAMTNVDQCETEREACTEINVKAVQRIFESCARTGAKLIHLSTDFVFDGSNGPYSEGDEPNPLSFYGESKWQAEQILLNSTYQNWAIARTIIVYGKGENLSRGHIVFWVRDMLRQNKEITIVDDQFRSPTWAVDLANGCLQIALLDQRGIFHLSGPQTLSIYELAKEVAQYYALDDTLIKPVKTGEFKQPAKRPLRTGFVIDKAQKLLQYNPHSVSQALAKMGE
ncbi:MAG TPA: dTDP-4-dehydrorhamnose reductase [Luteibaculaceae bacterium]|nr:dTDP-4-dehydrorhamnose reductase [Luteibaculaceae bacterium]